MRSDVFYVSGVKPLTARSPIDGALFCRCYRGAGEGGVIGLLNFDRLLRVRFPPQAKHTTCCAIHRVLVLTESRRTSLPVDTS